MFVGPVGLEPTTYGLKGRLTTVHSDPLVSISCSGQSVWPCANLREARRTATTTATSRTGNREPNLWQCMTHVSAT